MGGEGLGWRGRGVRVSKYCILRFQILNKKNRGGGGGGCVCMGGGGWCL